MPRCSAVGCTNSGDKGYKVYRFPRDKKRRYEWSVKVSRINENGKLWVPEQHSSHVVCEVHFSKDQFESKREDKKLKVTAVPTIFSHKQVKQTRRSPSKRNNDITENEIHAKKFILHDHGYYNKTDVRRHEDHTDDILIDSEMLPLVEPVTVLECTIPTQGSEEVKPLPKDLVTKLHKDYKRLHLHCIQLERQKNQAKVKLKRLQHKLGEATKNIEKLFRSDQMKSLQRHSKRGVLWSRETVKNSLQLWFSCGTTGYQELINACFPYPSIRTLQRHIQSIDFKSGILNQVFENLMIKVKAFCDNEKDCVLTIDEMSLKPCYEYNPSSQQLVGDVNLPNHKGLATHGLVFMLGGISSRWKQVVAHYFTGNSTDGAVLKPIITDVINVAHNIGLNVLCVTSDMGSMNRGFWKAFQIGCGRYSKVMCKCPHPVRKSEFLYFIADVPHVLKNIRNFLSTKEDIILSESVVKEHGLPDNVVNIKYLYDVVQYDEKHDLKIAYGLNAGVLDVTHFERMKVSVALKMFDKNVAAAIRFLVENQKLPRAALTTAWFLNEIRKWYDLLTSRSPVLALSKSCNAKYRDALTFLNSMIDVFRQLKAGMRWKPWQTGAILSTSSLLELQNILLTKKGYHFLLTSRFSQDCLENLFSCVRLRSPVPTALQFLRILKLISVAQIMKVSRKGSYEVDDREFLAEFLKEPSETRKQSKNDSVNDKFVKRFESNIVPTLEVPLLYNIVGYLVHSLLKKNELCTSCVENLKLCNGQQLPGVGRFVRLCELGSGTDCLIHVKKELLDVVLIAENHFRACSNKIMDKTLTTADMLAEIINLCSHIEVPNCHNVKFKLIKKYVAFRFHIFAKQLSTKCQKQLKKPKVYMGSKSLAMRALTL